MSRNPYNKNIPQAVLYHLGEKRVGQEYADLMTDNDVRHEGVRHLARRGTQALLLSAGLAGGVAVVGNAIDNSPTTIQQEHNRTQQELHPDPTQAEIVVTPPKDHGE